MGSAVAPIAGGLIGGFFGQKGADAQADAMNAAAGQSAAASMEAARLQKEYGEKALLTQLYLAQQQMAMQQEQARMAMDAEARALEAIEPYRRLGYAAIPDLYRLQQEAMTTPLAVTPPPELTQLFGQEQADLQRQLGQQMALQGVAGSPIASNLMSDQLRRMYSDQTARGYTAGLQKAQIEDARKYGRTLDMAQMGSQLGTQGYGLAGSQMPNLASAYAQLGAGLSGTLSGIGSGMGSVQQGLAGMYSGMAPEMSTIAAGPWANWANQIGNVVSYPGLFGGGQSIGYSPSAQAASNVGFGVMSGLSGIPGMAIPRL